MDIDSLDLSTAFNKIISQTKSQEDRLGEFASIVSSRDREIEMLQAMLSDANAQRSSMDNDLFELKSLREQATQLQEQVAGTVYMSTGRQQRTSENVSVAQQLRSLTTEYALLQSQLSEMQTQLLEANNRNLLLQQQTSHIAELESQLELAENEVSKMKQQSDQIKKHFLSSFS
jgi:chromosome segregation ATPase